MERRVVVHGCQQSTPAILLTHDQQLGPYFWTNFLMAAQLHIYAINPLNHRLGNCGSWVGAQRVDQQWHDLDGYGGPS